MNLRQRSPDTVTARTEAPRTEAPRIEAPRTEAPRTEAAPHARPRGSPRPCSPRPCSPRPLPRLLRRAADFGHMIRFSHTIFAMPFALASAAAAARFAPLGWRRLAWIIVAMVAARTAAMGFNRLADRHIDGRNPRTSNRELPRGVISPAASAGFVALATAVFLIAAWRLGPLPLRLAPVALFVIFSYSFTKRFTWASQLCLGLALAGAPLGAWIAVSGTLAAPAVVLGLGVLTWVAGFDTIYACQDFDFDRAEGLHSLPARFGLRRALLVARLLHLVTVAALLLFGLQLRLGTIYLLGVVVVAATLIYEHRLVRPHDLSRVDRAFFDLNGCVSIVFLIAVLAARPWLAP